MITAAHRTTNDEHTHYILNGFSEPVRWPWSRCSLSMNDFSIWMLFASRCAICEHTHTSAWVARTLADMLVYVCACVGVWVCYLHNRLCIMDRSTMKFNLFGVNLLSTVFGVDTKRQHWPDRNVLSVCSPCCARECVWHVFVYVCEIWLEQSTNWPITSATTSSKIAWPRWAPNEPFYSANACVSVWIWLANENSIWPASVYRENRFTLVF